MRNKVRWLNLEKEWQDNLFNSLKGREYHNDESAHEEEKALETDLCLGKKKSDTDILKYTSNLSLKR